MKCEFCNGNMSLEDLHCPHCGQLNKHAQQHIKAMKRYQGEFNETKEDVITVTKKYSQITVRCIIIVVLLIAVIVTAVLGSNAYSICRSMNRKAAERNKEENIKINQYEISEIISSRLREILNLSRKQINLLTKMEISSIIITGGTTELNDFNLVFLKLKAITSPLKPFIVIVSPTL